MSLSTRHLITQRACYYLPGISLPTRNLITNWACHFIGHVISSSMSSHWASHHLPGISLPIRYFITHQASHHPLGILSPTGHIILSGISSHRACHSRISYHPSGILSYQVFHYSTGMSSPTGNFITYRVSYPTKCVIIYQACHLIWYVILTGMSSYRVPHHLPGILSHWACQIMPG